MRIPDEVVCPWKSPVEHHAWEYLQQGWQRGRCDERERLVTWLLGEVTLERDGMSSPMPRYMLLTSECLKRYGKTGELRLFEVDKGGL